jgi:hypothetical protein
MAMNLSKAYLDRLKTALAEVVDHFAGMSPEEYDAMIQKNKTGTFAKALAATGMFEAEANSGYTTEMKFASVTTRWSAAIATDSCDDALALAA